MPFKTIMIKESTYKKLLRHKKDGESFTEFFEREFDRKKPDILQFAGAWSDMSEKELSQVKKRMAEFRRSFDEDAERRMHAIRARL